MTSDPILDGLNDAQRCAVTSDPEHSTLVLAGAGSGKTRALTHRFAWLVATQDLQPREILAVTFTNKAATEMRGRIEQLLNASTGGLWIGTFHALCRRMLLRFPKEAGLPENFQILDREDQKTLIRQILRDLGLPRKARDISNSIRWISLRKRDGVRSQHIEPTYPLDKQYIRILQRYEQRCQQSGLVDFDELLLRCVELLRTHDAVLQHYRQRFRHFLVDEFQDVDDLQYSWLRLLTDEACPLFVVGDDDQSIYGWRGAQPRHMLDFEKNHPGTRRWALEQNYRSSTPILNCANALIAHNTQRLKKRLWSDLPDTGPVEVLETPSSDLEATAVIQKVQQWKDRGGRWDECTVLYRTNRQSQPFETEMLRLNIPYRVYGGLRFFERREVKDALAYLRLCINPHDDVSWLRVCNLPARGLGNTTLERVRDAANAAHCSLFEAAREFRQTASNPRTAKALEDFENCLTGLREDTATGGLAQALRLILKDTGLWNMYLQSDEELEETRTENLDELVNSAAAFEDHFDSEEYEKKNVVEAFLDSATLEAGERGEGPSDSEAVQLMTLHMAKGLEFPLVIITGLEQGSLPMDREDVAIDEERRLFYVGMTRAQKSLTLTFAQGRRIYGQFRPGLEPSLFLAELPTSCLSFKTFGASSRSIEASSPRPSAAVTRPKPVFDSSVPPPGAEVEHPKFGLGTILEYEGQQPHLRVKVHFEQAGSKYLIYNHAKLTPL